MKREKSPCRRCRVETFFNVLQEVNWQDTDSPYWFAETFQIVECAGCGTKGLRYLFHNLEVSYGLEHEVYCHTYPFTDPPHISHKLPRPVLDLYREAFQALEAGALRLALVGLRGVIEAIAKDLGIPGKLETKIENLRVEGHISENDKQRLHVFRQVGNEAIHESKAPPEEQVRLIGEIVNHLVGSIYIYPLDKKDYEAS